MDEADIFAEIQRESDLVRSLVRKLSESISCRNLGEATDIFQKLIEREPRKPYALHVVRLANNLAIDLSSANQDESLTWLHQSFRLALSVKDPTALSQTASIMLKIFLKQQNWEKAKDCATLLGTYGSPFHEWSFKLHIALCSKCSQAILECIEKCLALTASTSDVKTIMKLVADKGNILALNSLMPKVMELAPKTSISCLDIAELFCLNVMLSVKFNLKDNLVDAFSGYVSFYCQLNAEKRKSLSRYHEKITDCVECKVEWILSLGVSVTANDGRIAAKLCSILVFLYDFDKQIECLIYALSLQTKFLGIIEGVEKARENLFSSLSRKKIQAEEAPLLRKLLLDLEIAPSIEEMNFSGSNLLSHGKCLGTLSKQALCVKEQLKKIGDCADLVISDCSCLDDTKILGFDVVFRLAVKIWNDNPDDAPITEPFLCQVSAKFSSTLKRMMEADDDQSCEGKSIWLSQALWNIGLTSKLKETPCLLFRLAAEMLPADDNTRLTCRVAQLGALLKNEEASETQLVPAMQEINGALRSCEDTHLKGKLSLLLLKGSLLLKRTDEVSRIVGEAIRDADLLTLEMFAAILATYPHLREVQTRLLRMSISLARSKFDVALMRCALVLIRLLMKNSLDSDGISDIMPEIVAFCAQVKFKCPLNDDEAQLLVLFVIAELWNTSIRVMGAGGVLKEKALALREMASSLVDFAPTYRLYLKGKLVRS